MNQFFRIFCLSLTLGTSSAVVAESSQNRWPIKEVAPALSAEDGMPFQAQYLKGLTIVIDPGHGGDPEQRMGPNKLAREHIINMRTAEKLKEWLEKAGVKVIMTITEDVDMPLSQRAQIANDAKADLFLSLHHNASGRKDANYSSVWYHLDGSEYPASLDVSRKVANALARLVPLEEPQHNGIYSDSLMYAGGFGVLRAARVPAVLIEYSFFTHEEEERRLADVNYNHFMAYTTFVGLCEWAANGIPKWEFKGLARQPDGTHVATVELSDGMKEGWGNKELRLSPNCIRVTVDGEPAEFSLEGKKLTVDVRKNGTDTKEFLLDVQFENRYKNSSITPPQTIKQ